MRSRKVRLMSLNGHDKDKPKKRKLLPNDRQEINMLYEDAFMADYKQNGGKPDPNRIISLLVYLLWSDDGYRYLGDAVDEVVRLGWLINDYKQWEQKTFSKVITKGETGNPHLDDVLRRTPEVRKMLKILNSDMPPGAPKYRTVLLKDATFDEHQQKGNEYYQEARALFRKGDYHTGLYLVGVRSGRDLSQPPPKEVLETFEIEPPEEEE
jgi:hypothetical protein